MTKVLLVDDSALILSELSLVVQKTGTFDAVLKAGDGEEAIRTTMRDRPDLIILDLQMPRMDGFTFLRWLMANHPVPVLVFSSMGSDQNIFKAMEIGAVDFITKPDTYMQSDFQDYLVDKIKGALLANVRPGSTNPQPTGMLSKPDKQSQRPPASGSLTCICMGASTGGPTAVQRILEAIDHSLNIPVLISQHMPRAFTSVFSQRLNLLVDAEVKEAEDMEKPSPGTVYVSPGNRHMEIREGRIRLINPDLNDRYIPSVDRLLSSASSAYGKGLAAVILTGMGNDGATGIRDVHHNNGRILTEAPESCIVYGMPKAAYETGLVTQRLPLEAIGERLCQWMRAADCS